MEHLFEPKLPEYLLVRQGQIARIVKSLPDLTLKLRGGRRSGKARANVLVLSGSWNIGRLYARLSSVQAA